MKSSISKRGRKKIDDRRKRFIVYQMVEMPFCEGTYEDVCKAIGCVKTTIQRAMQHRDENGCAVVKGYHIYKEELLFDNEDEEDEC